MPNFIKHIAFKVEDVEKERAFYENVFGYKHVNTVRRKGKNGDHISHHLTDGYMDLTLIHYEHRIRTKPISPVRRRAFTTSAWKWKTSTRSSRRSRKTAANPDGAGSSAGQVPFAERPGCRSRADATLGKETLAAGVHGEVLE